MSFLDFLPYYLLITIEIAVTLFVLVIVTYYFWEWLTGSEIEEKRIIQQNV